MKRIRIVHAAGQTHGRVSDADTDETVDMVRSALIDLRVDALPTARIEVFVAEVDVTVEVEHVRWFGLDRVPVEALRAELARRESHNQQPCGLEHGGTCDDPVPPAVTG